MTKRGLISVYIIMGIVLLAIFGFFLYFSSSYVTNAYEQNLDSGSGKLEIYIQECVENAGEDAIYLMRKRGRIPKVRPVKFKTSSNEFEVELFYDGGEILLPTIDEFEKDFSDYVETSVKNCIKRFSIPGTKLDYEEPSVATVFSNEKATVFVVAPVTLVSEKSNVVVERDYFFYENPLNFPKIHTQTKNIIDEFREYGGYFNPGFLNFMEDDTLSVFSDSSKKLYIFKIQEDKTSKEYWFGARLR